MAQVSMQKPASGGIKLVRASLKKINPQRAKLRAADRGEGCAAWRQLFLDDRFVGGVKFDIGAQVAGLDAFFFQDVVGQFGARAGGAVQCQ